MNDKVSVAFEMGIGEGLYISYERYERIAEELGPDFTENDIVAVAQRLWPGDRAVERCLSIRRAADRAANRAARRAGP